jgi:hypothetical protein
MMLRANGSSCVAGLNLLCLPASQGRKRRLLSTKDSVDKGRKRRLLRDNLSVDEDAVVIGSDLLVLRVPVGMLL